MNAHSNSNSLRRATALGASFLLLTACSGGGGGGGGGGGSGDLEASLQQLGVDTTTTPRETAPGVTMEPQTSPLGNKPKLSLTNELLLCNIGLAGAINNAAPMLLAEVTDGNGAAALDLLHGQDDSQVPFLRHVGGRFDFPQSTSAVVAADCDGNGLDEIVFVYQNGIETRVRKYADSTQAFVDSDVQVAANANVTNVAAVAADLDLDGHDDLVIALTVAGAARVTMWRFDGGSYSQMGGEVEILPDLGSSSMSVQLAAGNIDADARPELTVAVQELAGASGAARCVVLDDQQTGFVTLRSEPFIERDQNQVLRTAYTCSVAMGDIDGDGLDEIVLGGVTELLRSCDTPQMLMAAYDDREHQFALLGGAGHLFQRSLSGCNSPTDRIIRTVHVNTLDLDNDGIDEISANIDVFDDFLNAAPFTAVAAWRLPQIAMWDSTSTDSLFDRNTSSFVVGDFTGDDHEDIATYYQNAGSATSQVERVRIYGLTPLSSTIQELRSIQCVNNNPVQGVTYPALLPVNVDLDSPVLSYSEADYKLVFSEPIVLAALAAPPTRDGIGQNVAGSHTAFGNTTTTTTERERSVTFSVGVTVGVNLDGGALTQSEFSLKDKLTVAGSRTRGTAYELSKTIIFTSAPTEDLVVFSSVPLDQYTYTILSHSDAQMIGQRVILSYPRTPVTMQAERGFFNRAVPDRLTQIDGSVFQHTIGAPETYPTLAEKNALRGGARRPAGRAGRRRPGRRDDRGHAAGRHSRVARRRARGQLRAPDRGDGRRRRRWRHDRRLQHQPVEGDLRQLDDLHGRGRRHRRRQLRGQPVFVRVVHLHPDARRHGSAVPGPQLLGAVAAARTARASRRPAGTRRGCAAAVRRGRRGRSGGGRSAPGGAMPDVDCGAGRSGCSIACPGPSQPK